MPRLRVLAAAVVILFAPSIARADLPSIGPCTVPERITLVGHSSGSPDAGGTFEVIVRMFPGNPVPGSVVVVDFSGFPDLRLSSDVAGSGAIVDCPTQTIRKVTDVNGRAVFSIVGAALGAANCYGGFDCPGRVRIYADGFLIGDPRASALDLDGSGGVGAADLSIWLSDFGTSLSPLRSDYDGDGAVGGGDLSRWLAGYGGGSSPQSGATYCP